MKVAFIIYADLESLLQRVDTYNNNNNNNNNSNKDKTEKSSTTKINKHITSGHSLFTQYSFDLTKNKLDCYRGKDSMKRFCEDLKEHAIKIINYEKKNT